ncbi:MAG: YheT family hydrolase [Ramlibacter sp.]
MQDYRAPWWLPGGNLQTIWPALFARRTRGEAPQYRRERWTTPDGDFLDVDWLVGETGSRRLVLSGAKPSIAVDQAGLRVAQHQPTEDDDRPLLVLFHGLEGSSRSHYAEAFADVAARNGLAFVVPHFRGCSGEINLAPRAYHSGDHEEVGWILARLREHHRGPVLSVGVSLGGNALMRWAGEHGQAAGRLVRAVACVCSPLDLAAGGRAIGRGFNRLVYTTMFLRSMKPKALRKWAQHPGLFDREALLAARDLYEFDNVFTAPLHGFRDTEDYWARASAKPLLGSIRIPALALNARNDPFIPAESLPVAGEGCRGRCANPAYEGDGGCVTLWQPPHGGHVGFPSGRWPGHVLAMPEAVTAWLLQAAGLAAA